MNPVMRMLAFFDGYDKGAAALFSMTLLPKKIDREIGP
jgi:hypothetical protein